MRSFGSSLPLAAALFASSTLAWLPSCGWNDCMGSWDGSSCASTSGWACFCSNSTAIAQVNTCVATSCTNATDQEAIYGAIAQMCANNGVQVEASQEATYSATSGGSAWPSQITAGPGWGPGGGWNSGQWSSWVSACSTALPGAPSGWGGPGSGPWGSHPSGGPGGPGGWGPGGFGGPWGTKASGVNCDQWTTWTGGWGPFSSWTGTWSGCSTTTASPSPATVTTTMTSNGQVSVITGTTFGVQAVKASATASSSSDNAAVANTSVRGLGLVGALLGTVFAAMLAL